MRASLPAIKGNAKNLVEFLVADIQKSAGIPDRPFRETKSAGNNFKFCVARNEFPELRRCLFQLEFTLRSDFLLTENSSSLQQ